MANWQLHTVQICYASNMIMRVEKGLKWWDLWNLETVHSTCLRSCPGAFVKHLPSLNKKLLKTHLFNLLWHCIIAFVSNCSLFDDLLCLCIALYIVFVCAYILFLDRRFISIFMYVCMYVRSILTKAAENCHLFIRNRSFFFRNSYLLVYFYFFVFMFFLFLFSLSETISRKNKSLHSS